MRVLPDFILVGAQRCGTTSLFRYLVSYPGVFPSSPKEVHFFSNHFKKGIAWYRSHFPLEWQKRYVERVRKRKFLTGEATPYYLAHPHAPRRIFQALPEVLLIILFRNPIDRAYSHYHFELSKGVETLSFEGAIDREQQRLDQELEKMLADGTYRSFNHQHFSYLSRGHYADQLEAWRRLFTPDQMHIVISEGFFLDPERTLRNLAAFAGLPDRTLSRYPRYHSARYPPMDPATRKRLIEHFKPHNLKLSEQLGRPLDWDQ
jgi:hypothetical protein